MRCYTTILITGVICILVGTSCGRDDIKESDAAGITAGDASPDSGGNRPDSGSTSAGEEAGKVDSGSTGPVSDSGNADTGSEEKEDAGPVVEPQTGDCSSEGATEECYSGPSSTQGVGICKAGTQTCEDGTWGECEGMVTREEETCDGTDEDCDGETDEDLSLGSCVPEGTTEDELDDECVSGQLKCVDGSTVCEVINAEQKEQCNGEDDDCDGETDEDVDTACFTGSAGCTKGDDGDWECQGICRVGSQQCVDGELSERCSGEVTPRPSEQCYQFPAVDDDCDGEVDESCSCQPGDTQECYTGPSGTSEVGTCRNGEQTCMGWGFWGFCTGQVLPGEETCENAGEDNDCDGDEDDVPTGEDCFTGQSGRCSQGQIECRNGDTVCVANNDAIAEQCNLVDDDCDGATDEGFDFQYDEQNCGTCWTRCFWGQQCCEGRCVNLNSDPRDCGSCGHSCASGESCVNGSCSCGNGTTLCNNQCVNLNTNVNNCGSCGHACPSGATCNGGNCNCPGGQTICNNQCVNTSNNASHCGTCNHACQSGASCVGGGCQCPNNLPWTCNNECVNTTNDERYCGNCFTGCPTGTECIDSECECPNPSNTFCVGAGCVNTQTNTSHCGTCGHACPSGASCSTGTCVCPSGQIVCSNACVNPTEGRCGCGPACGEGQTCVNTDDTYECQASAS